MLVTLALRLAVLLFPRMVSDICIHLRKDFYCLKCYVGSQFSGRSGGIVTLAWDDSTVMNYSLSAMPPVENCKPNCTVDPYTTQFTFTGLEAEVTNTQSRQL